MWTLLLYASVGLFVTPLAIVFFYLERRKRGWAPHARLWVGGLMIVQVAATVLLIWLITRLKGFNG